MHSFPWIPSLLLLACEVSSPLSSAPRRDTVRLKSGTDNNVERPLALAIVAHHTSLHIFMTLYIVKV